MPLMNDVYYGLDLWGKSDYNISYCVMLLGISLLGKQQDGEE